MIADDVRLYVVDSLRGMERLAGDWRRLADEAPAATPFQSWEWNVAAAAADEGRARLRIVVAEGPGGEAAGIAPFCVRRRGPLGQRVLELVGGARSDYLDLLVLEPYAAAFAGRLREWIERSDEWRVLDLARLRGLTVERLAGLDGTAAEPQGVCPYALLPDSLERYERSLPVQLRSTVRRMTRTLDGGRRLAFSVARTDVEVAADLPVLFDLHERRQRARGRAGGLADPRWRRALGEASAALARAGRVRLGLARIDGRPAAGCLSFRTRDREHYYLTGMDPDLGRFSPGSLLLHRVIGEAIRDGVRVYDLGIGDEPYKSWWANARCQLYRVTRPRSRVAGVIWRQTESWRAAARRSALLRRLYHAALGRSGTPRGPRAPEAGR